jgi:hypothetical protein
MGVIKPIDVGQLLFAIAMGVFGIQYLHYGKYVGGLPPVPPWAPGGATGAYLVGVALIVTAVSLAIRKKAELSALVIGGLFLFCVIFLHLQHFGEVVHDGIGRTRAFRAFCAGGCSVRPGGSVTGRRSRPVRGRGQARPDGPAGPWSINSDFRLAALPVRHVFGDLGARMASSARVLDLFHRTGMIVAGLAIAVNTLGSVAAAGLALMFGLWVLVLHGPRVIAHPHNGDEWSSLFVALAFLRGVTDPLRRTGSNWKLAETRRSLVVYLLREDGCRRVPGQVDFG